VALTATGAVAQPPPPGPPSGPLDTFGLEPGASVEEKDTRELVETLLMVRLARELGLEKEQTVTMVQRVSETREALQTQRKERQELLNALRNSVQAGEEAAVIQGNLEKVRQHDRAMVETRQRVFDELAQGLTPTQQARLYVFLEDFENQMRQMAQQARRRGMQGGPDQQMGPPPGGQGMQGGPGQPMGPRFGGQGMQGGARQQLGPPPGGQGMQGGGVQQMGPPPGGQGMQGGAGQQPGPPQGQGYEQAPPPPVPIGAPDQPQQ
jgi:hypothetical protein